MKMVAAYGISDFIICGGYKVHMIKDYFRDFYIFQSDITVDLMTNTVICHKNRTENWRVTVVDTGIDTFPGQRLLRVKEYIGEEDFLMVHGDCVSNIDIPALLQFHKENDKILSLTVANPTGRSEALPLDNEGCYLGESQAKVIQNQAWADACCRVYKKEIFDYLLQDYDIGGNLFKKLSADNQMLSYFHHGFWCPMETKRDKVRLEKMWKSGVAPWKVWED